MLDGRRWTTENLNLNTAESYCYGDEELNCRRYGRLYTWESARRGCRSLGDGWRLPTDDDWRQLADYYGGVYDGADGGKAAYEAFLIGGSSGFNAVFGGGRTDEGEYDDLEAHGFYWTATESDLANAWFYNLGRGAMFLNRHSDGQKGTALAVRCVWG